MNTKEGSSAGVHLWHHCAIFLFACCILVARRPDALFHAQFCAEDGLVWFPDAYNHGWWQALMLPWTGIFMTVPRLGAALALLVPLASAPLVLSLIQIGLLALPVNLILSARSAGWGSLRFRALMAGIYLALPNNTEISYGISWAQWPLALCAILLVVASAPRNRIERVLDCILFVLSGLSGPSCILLLPIAVFIAFKRKNRWLWVPPSIFAACAMVQAYALLVLDPKGRPTQFPLGANLEMFTRILSGNILLGALLGRTRLAILPGPGALIFLSCVAVAGLGLVAFCFWKSGVEMKLFLVFTSMLLAVSLVRPTAYPPAGTTVWQLLGAASDIRYWIFPSLAFAWCLLWCTRSKGTALKSVSAVLLGVMCFASGINWRHPALKDLQFAEYARRFEAAAPGTVMIIPENPAGWKMRLVKHP
jgi:hypothetical protein